MFEDVYICVLFIFWLKYQFLYLLFILFNRPQEYTLIEIKPLKRFLYETKYIYIFQNSKYTFNYEADSPFKFVKTKKYYFVNVFFKNIPFSIKEIIIRIILMLSFILICYINNFSLDSSKYAIVFIFIFLIFYLIKYDRKNNFEKLEVNYGETLGIIKNEKSMDNESDKFIVNIDLVDINYNTNCYRGEGSKLGEKVLVQYSLKYPDFNKIIEK